MKSHTAAQTGQGGIDEGSFQAMVGRIRRRPPHPLTGQWFNIVEAAGHRFLQGPIKRDITDQEEAGGLAYISRRVHPEDIAGFWPETKGRLMTKAEEDALAVYISRLDGRDVELLVPLRNTARPVRWLSFEDSREYSLYAASIYPEILKTISKLPCRRLLDVGCGAGNLLAALREILPRATFTGIDISPDNVEAAKEKGLENIHEGNIENIDEIFSNDGGFDTLLFCGVLNRQIMDSDTALAILKKSLKLLVKGGYIIITGYSSCHFSARELTGLGLTVRKKNIPENILKDYNDFYLRQFYVAVKN